MINAAAGGAAGKENSEGRDSGGCGDNAGESCATSSERSSSCNTSSSSEWSDDEIVDNAAQSGLLIDEDASSNSDDMDDDMAELMMQMMRKHAKVVGAVLAERVALIESIKWLSQHIPQCVLTILGDEVVRLEKQNRVASTADCSRLPRKIHCSDQSFDRQRGSSSSVSRTSDITDNGDFGEGVESVHSRASGGRQSSCSPPKSDSLLDIDKEAIALPQCRNQKDRATKGLVRQPNSSSVAKHSLSHVAGRQRVRQPASFLDPFPDHSADEGMEHIKTFSDPGSRRLDSENCQTQDEEISQSQQHLNFSVRQNTSTTPSSASSPSAGRKSRQNETLSSSQKSYNDEHGDDVLDRNAYSTSDINQRKNNKSDLRYRTRRCYKDSFPKVPIHVNEFHCYLPSLPFATYHNCALLFVDISGFTQLSQVLDVECLSKTINSYFQLITAEVINYGGDILKYAGDAIFAEWQVCDGSDAKEKSRSQYRREKVCGARNLLTSLQGCVSVAAQCGAKIVATCSHYPVFAQVTSPGADLKQGAQVGTLNVHCGLGAGEVAAVHVGDDSRRELLLIGDPIDQVAKAESVAALGELVASSEAFSILRKICYFSGPLLHRDSSEGSPEVIAASRHSHFCPKEKNLTKLVPYLGLRDAATSLDIMCERLDVSALRKLRQLISLYVHKVVVDEEMAEEEHSRPSMISPQERHRAEAELRNVYVLFIMPLLTSRLTGDRKKDQELFELLNKVVLLTKRELQRYSGQLRQFIVDDKGADIGKYGQHARTTTELACAWVDADISHAHLQ